MNQVLHHALTGTVCTTLLLIAACGTSHRSSASSRFETISIRAANSSDGGVTFFEAPDGIYKERGRSLEYLIWFAYGTPTFKISGGPNWIKYDRFDIAARVRGNADDYFADGLPTAMRKLLAERFKLVLHHETKDLPVYALTIANRNGTIGPHLWRSDTDCATLLRRTNAYVLARPPCPMHSEPGKVKSGGGTLLQLTQVLSEQMNRVVLDRTGLTGPFEFDLEWKPDQPVSTAIEEQLGLKLESARAPVDVLVIDHVEKPAEN